MSSTSSSRSCRSGIALSLGVEAARREPRRPGSPRRGVDVAAAMCEPYPGHVPWGFHPPWHMPPLMFTASRGALLVRDLPRSGHWFGVVMVTRHRASSGPRERELVRDRDVAVSRSQVYDDS